MKFRFELEVDGFKCKIGIDQDGDIFISLGVGKESEPIHMSPITANLIGFALIEAAEEKDKE